MDSLKRLTDPVYCITRLIVALMFACHGGQKILHFPPGGYPAKEAWGYCGGAIELVCGFLIAFGLFTRLAAFIAAAKWLSSFSCLAFPAEYSVTRRPRWSDSYQFSTGRSQPCSIAGASFSLSSMARADGVSMR
jgi:uncharacterized membrane protein YphA (DoxX/SURF4 family)